MVNYEHLTIPHLIISCSKSPKSEGDKEICSAKYVNPSDPSRNFTVENATIEKCSSSKYYCRKDFKFKK